MNKSPHSLRGRASKQSLREPVNGRSADAGREQNNKSPKLPEIRIENNLTSRGEVAWFTLHARNGSMLCKSRIYASKFSAISGARLACHLLGNAKLIDRWGNPIPEPGQ